MTVFFMHIPKTGGGTFHHTMAQQFITVAPGMEWNKTPEFSFAGYEYIAGHYPFCFYEDRLPHDTLLVTLLRDPVARVLSHYAYESEHGYWPDADYTKAVKGMTIEEWLNYEPARKNWNNLMTRYFSDGILADLGRALDNLKLFNVVGFLDVHNGLQDAIKKTCKLANVSFPDELGVWNKASNPVALRELPPAILGRIQRENELDTILYNCAMENAK